MPQVLPTPHGDKLRALLANSKLPQSDRPRVQAAILMYETWLNNMRKVHGTLEHIVTEMVRLFNEYRFYIDVELIFDSPNDFLYRQKGQLKLDNSVIEEFLPVVLTTVLHEDLQGLDLLLGPTNCFSSLRFESSIREERPGGGVAIRSKDQDFAISRKLFIKTSHYMDFRNPANHVTSLVYVAAECKTNLDKTMFQEAAATALDVKTAVPSAKYYLLCEWLDMTPISTSITAIDEIIVLRKYKRLPSNVRAQFNNVEGRTRNRETLVNYLISHPFAPDTFMRFVNHVQALFRDDSEENIFNRG